MKKNEGYTLIEMIIVISIIVVLSAMAYVSLSILSSARARDKAIEFDTDIATLQTKARNMDAEFSFNSKTYNQFCIVFFTLGAGTDIYQAPGYYDIADDDCVVDITQKKKLPRKISMEFQGTSPHAGVLSTTEPVGDDCNAIAVIRFNKRGECMEGYGTYSFTQNKNGSTVAVTKIRQNGSHETK